MKNLFDITGKNAVVTGGAGTLGSNIARHLVGQGVNVVLLGRHKENTEAMAKELSALNGGKVMAVVSDVLDHLEAKNGYRSDGFTMSIYSAIMVGLFGLAIGIVSGMLGACGYDATLVKQTASAENALVFTYLMMDMISFVLTIVLLFRMDVEKYAEEDQKIIQQRNEK